MNAILESPSIADRYAEIARRLITRYGFPDWRPNLPPVDELVDTILSQNTTDASRDKAFDQLRQRLPTWEAVRDALPELVIDAIRPAGLSNQKGPHIQAALRRISEEQGSITLEFLRDMPLEQAKAWLTSLDGVGPKTAAIVLLFSMGRPVFPVDTHVHRVTKRLGLIGANVTADRAHELLADIVPSDTYYAAHLNFIRHGRQVCHARQPACDDCPLTDLCLFYQENAGQQSAERID